MVREVKSQMKVPFFDPSNSVSIIESIATYKLACHTNRIHEGTAVWIFPCFVKVALTSTINSRMSSASDIVPAVASSQSVEPLRQKKLIRTYTGVVSYLLTRLANDQAIAEISSAILRYTQPASMASMQYADDLYSQLCKVADVYDEYTLDDIFNESVHTFLCHILKKY